MLVSPCWYRHVELEKLVRYVKGELKLAIGNRSPVFSREIRATVVCVRDAGIERVFMSLTDSSARAIT